MMQLKSIKLLGVLWFLFGIIDDAVAQRPYDSTNLDSLKHYESQLKDLGDSLIDGSSQAVRLEHLVNYIPKLVETLKIPGSFEYPFDSLKFMFTFTPPDKRFRLYNWNLEFNNGTYRFYGVIQKNNEDSLEIYPLYDRVEDRMQNVEDTTLRSEGWYGAQYYKLIQKEIEGKKYYLMLGWDGFKQTSNKKVIEVLHFDEDGQPVFGAPILEENNKLLKRKIFQFREEAVMQLDYNKSEDVIVFSHLVPPNPEAKGKEFLYMPDGTYDFFVFDEEKNRWIKKDQYFDAEQSPADDSKEINE